MAKKPIYTVEVDDTAFKRFAAEFDKHQEMLAKMPGAWSESGKAMVAATMAMAGINQENAKKQDEERKKAKDAADEERKATEASARLWRDMGHSTSNVFANVTGITKSLLTWTGIVGVFSGIFGGGSLIGLDRFAMRIGAQRAAAQGVGVSIGEQKAFGVNYGRFFGNPDGLLSNIADAKSDLSKRWAFSAMGVNNVDGRDPVELAMEMSQRAKSLYGQNQTQQFAAAHGLTQFYSMEDLRRLSAGNLGEAETGTRRDINYLGVGDAAAKNWQDFSVKLHEAGERIESAFAGGLSRLTPELGKITDSLIHLFDVMADSPKVAAWLDGVADALDRLGKWLGKNSPGDGGSSPSGNRRPDSWADILNGRPTLKGNAPVGFISAIGEVESHGDPHATSPKGAKGLFQFTDDAWKDFGEGDPYDPDASTQAALRYIGRMNKVFNGDLEEIAASYNAGEGGVKMALKKASALGGDWKNYLPRETQNYVKQVMSIYGANGAPGAKATITVNNNVGANIVTNAEQAAVTTR